MLKVIISARDLVFRSRVAAVIFFELVIGVIGTTFFISAFIDIREALFNKELLGLDEMIMNFFYLHRTPLLSNLMITVSTFGYEIPIIAGILLFLILIKKHKKEALTFAFIVLMAPSINGILKKVIQRSRPPFEPLVSTSSYSFPSGHAIGSLVFYMTLSYFIYHFTGSKKLSFIAFIISVLLIFVIGISRMYLGVHYPTDILAGWMGGLIWFSCILVINRTLIFFKLFKENKRLSRSSY